MKTFKFDDLDNKMRHKRKERGHKIILEGIDGAGKTTIANMLKERYPNYEIIHFGRNTENNFDEFIKILSTSKNIIFDRAMYGQFIYQTHNERKNNGWLSIASLLVLEKVVESRDYEVIYVSSNLEKCYENCKNDCQDSYYTMEHIRDLDSRYRHMFNNISSIEVTELSNEYDSGEEDIQKLVNNFDWKSLPEIIAVDFDGCLVEDKFPRIGKPNEELFDYLKKKKKEGSKLILWTCRTHDNIIEACDFCANRGLYFDAINDNIKEVKEAFDGGPRKVYASKYLDDKSVFVKAGNDYINLN